MRVLKLLVAVLAVSALLPSLAQAWLVTPPTQREDWKQLTSIVTRSFDAPKSDGSANIWNQAQWTLVEQHLTYQFTYQHHVQTARKMKGLKYTILVAKAAGADDRVVGVAEIGIKVDNDAMTTTTTTTTSGQLQDKDDSNAQQLRRPTIGSLCVDDSYRQQGVGRALISRCEQLVRKQWKEDAIFAEVQVQNDRALNFFQACGYELLDRNKQVMVTVQQRREMKELPHYILRKQLHETEPAAKEVTATSTSKQSGDGDGDY